MGLFFSFDIGIASVGWAVVDRETYSIVECGSNIFSSAEAENNVERRSARQLRRLHRRHHTRINDFEKLWKKEMGNLPKENTTPLLQLRVKALSEKVTEDELFFALKGILQHRGISYLEDALDEDNKGMSDYQKGIKLNQDMLEKKYPCQIQLERLEQYGSYRGATVTQIDGEQVTLSNIFTINAYRKELYAVFDTQKKNNSKLTDRFE